MKMTMPLSRVAGQPIYSSILSRLALACLGLLALAAPSPAADWPQWGGTNSKNMASDEKGLPDSFDPGERDAQTGTIRMETTKNVKWARKVCRSTYSSPVIAGGKVFLCGVESSKGGSISCLDEQTGKLLWRWETPKSRYNFGICATPIVEGNQLYVVNQNSEAMCLDVNGEPDGSDGLKARVLWTFDMEDKFQSSPADTYCGSCVIDGDLLYAATSNGINPLGAEGRMFVLDKQYKGGRKILDDANVYAVTSPKAPNVVVLDKKTGRLAATDEAPIVDNLMKGQWSSFALGQIGDRKLVVYGGGDGVCYAFEPLPSVPAKPVKLKTVWSCDCIPNEYKNFGGMPMIVHYYHGDSRWGGTMNANDGNYMGMSEIIGTPVFYKNRIYVAIGRDTAMGRGRGALQCIDATKTGDISAKGRLWTYQGLDWTTATVSIADGLVYLIDNAGRLHCVDAETGKLYWMHAEKCGTVLGSTLVADGKVFVPTQKGLFIFAAGKEDKLLGKVTVGAPIYSTPVIANGTLYVASFNGWLYAVTKK